MSGVEPGEGLRLQRLDSGDARGRYAYDPRYGQPDLWQAGTQGQFSVKFTF